MIYFDLPFKSKETKDQLQLIIKYVLDKTLKVGLKPYILNLPRLFNSCQCVCSKSYIVFYIKLLVNRWVLDLKYNFTLKRNPRGNRLNME